MANGCGDEGASPEASGAFRSGCLPGLRIAPRATTAAARIVVLSILGCKALVALAHARMSVPSTEKCARPSKFRLSANPITSVKKLSTTACSSKRSRFLEKLEWSPHRIVKGQSN